MAVSRKVKELPVMSMARTIASDQCAAGLAQDESDS